MLLIVGYAGGRIELVPFAGCEVAIVVLLLVCGGWVEQLAGSAIVNGDPRQAVVAGCSSRHRKHRRSGT